MDAGSDEATERNRSFIGFYTDPELKNQAQKQAKQEGVSLSEWMRRQLDHLDNAADQQAVTP